MSQSGEKTEKATPKKLREQREKGNVLKSRDLAVALQLLSLFAFFRLAGPAIARGLQGMVRSALSGRVLTAEPLTIQATSGYYGEVMGEALLIIAPLFAFVVFMGALVNIVQTGFLLTGKTLAAKAERISPVAGAKRMFSSRSVVEMLKSVAKIGVVVLSVYQQFWHDTRDIASLVSYRIDIAATMVLDLCQALALQLGVVFLVIAVFDYLYQWYKHNKDMRMTKQEVKDEYKTTEGNPQNKSRIRSIQRLLASQRMMADIPLADVVVTNPTHYAIALRYDPDRSAAPVVVAKGKNLVAQRIKEIARDNRVAIVENKPLAQSLHKMCKVGSQIPADLYGAVAEVLAYVFKLKGGARA